ncbi:MAG: flagellar basal body rod protein FlgB [Alphaproteobacteria bacterium]|nr:flagellar basal body rod protein FlgB [Alphaproteobacteria bacterium]MCD8519817.1 flagellar basal body rod protein FlgB [Alphaproteobacteria bacterium]MCD8570281.1 flagellar basal body rod protein FlgB [Alphaproteobacteria bacterium]
MTTENIALFKAMGAKMHYLNQRQRVIAQNIANADTNGYRPQDLKDADFSRLLRKVTESNNIKLDTTARLHMPPPNEAPDPKEGKQRKVYEVAPDGNAVIMEEQMIKANRTTMDYNLMTSLYQKNIGMLRTALGRGN